MSAPFYLSISETQEKLRKRELSPVEVVTAHLERVQELQPKLNAFVHFDAESALARARKVETALVHGEELPALAGIPLTVKSSMDVAGWPCPAGSLLRKDYVPATDAVAVARLEAAGAILLGNTNAPEFLMAYETDNLLTGKTSNPGTRNIPRAARAAEKPQPSLRLARWAALEATVAGRFAHPRTFPASAD